MLLRGAFEVSAILFTSGTIGDNLWSAYGFMCFFVFAFHPHPSPISTYAFRRNTHAVRTVPYALPSSNDSNLFVHNFTMRRELNRQQCKCISIGCLQKWNVHRQQCNLRLSAISIINSLAAVHLNITMNLVEYILPLDLPIHFPFQNRFCGEKEKRTGKRQDLSTLSVKRTNPCAGEACCCKHWTYRIHSPRCELWMFRY